MSPEHLAIIDHRVNTLEEDRNEILQVLKELNVAVNKLVIIDERQVQAALIMDRLTKASDRAHERIDNLATELAGRIDSVKTESSATAARSAKSLEDLTSALGKSVSALKSEANEAHKQLEARIDTLEKAEVENKRVRGWIFALIGMVGVAVLAAFLKLIGLSV